MGVMQIYDVNTTYLRSKARKVSRISDSERKILDDMVETMRAADGIGLAGPQVGVLLRLIVVELDEELFQLVNPEIVEFSEETDIREEGCLSLPNYYGPVERPVRVVVKAQDRNGKKVKLKVDDWLARALQHEIDHLDGILFFDPPRMRSLSDLRYRPPGSEEEEETAGEEEGAAREEASADARPSRSRSTTAEPAAASAP